MKRAIYALLLSAFAILPVHLSAQWTTSGSNIYYSNSGNVGIGITNPSQKLHVYGRSYLNGNVGINTPPLSDVDLRIFNSNLPRLEILNNYGKLNIAIANGPGSYANDGQAGDAVLLNWGPTRKNIIFLMPTRTNDGNTFIGFSDNANGTWAKFYNNRVFNVDGTTQTRNLLISKPNGVTNWNNLWQSGFYESLGAANSPGPGGWYWGIHMGHSSNSDNYKYGGQIAIYNDTQNTQMYFRAVGSDGAGVWRKALYNGINDNIGIGTPDPHEKLDVVGNISIQGEGDVGPTLVLKNNSKGGHDKAMYWRIYNMTGEYGNSLQFWAYDERSWAGNRGNKFTITDDGFVGIKTTRPGVELDVVGTIRAHEVKVCLNQGCDFVFEPDYKLMPLNELDQFITTNRHLPEVAPAAVMESEGIDLAEMNAKLLQKIEEQTLYIIELNKRVTALEDKK